MKTQISALTAAVLAALSVACTDGYRIPLSAEPETVSNVQSAPAPSGMQLVSSGGEQHNVWPFTSADLGATTSDPINLIFRGKSDPRAVRAALFALDGNRTAFGFPASFPFNCTWSDAYGDPQTAYADDKWSASVVQLQCGSYGPVRFHIRLFPAGEWTIANAHFEVVIPGTADHQVLSWELAEQLVVVDFARSGLLGAAPSYAAGLNPAGGFRAIPGVIYNGLPAELKAVTGGPSSTTTEVPIPTDGNATILYLAGEATPVIGMREDTYSLTYNQVIPRPFCSTGPMDYVLVQGPITLTKRVTTSGNALTSSLRADGTLTVTQINPLTGQTGITSTATIADVHDMMFTGDRLELNTSITRREVRPDGTGTSSQVKLQVGGRDSYNKKEVCS